ncbi:MAG: hypothetical protein K0R24_781 [Gammaproteobacteria bacterium]|jgi:hypothetical protein|nr:hypothetical protein [Gammaproteobacteria bacterium]
MHQLTNDQAINVFKAWTAIEVLSPQTFKNREDLAYGKKELVASFNDTVLPWEKDGGEKAPEGKKLYYQVVIGTLNYPNAIKAILTKYTDTNEERTTGSGDAVLAVALIDRQGQLLKDVPSVSVSSFAWGLGCVLNSNLEELGKWAHVEKGLIKSLDNVLRIKKGDDVLPINRQLIENAYEFLIDKLSLPKELVKNTYFALRVYEPSAKIEKPQPLLLNSFYINDILEASGLFSKNNIPANLRRYVGTLQPSSRTDLLQFENLKEAVAPHLIPLACWPSKKGQSLVMLQQAAVNLSLSQLEKGGIIAVNGPPGTGKTTLLRDIIAGIVTEKAIAMSDFDDPALAFTQSGERIKAGNSSLTLYALNEKLKGFEIIIASSNNKAVQNVSAEMPNITAIPEEAKDLRFFEKLSDNLFGFKTWGLISAVLGNSNNRYDFSKKFWWDKEYGLSLYLSHICGIDVSIPIMDEEKKIIGKRLPYIIDKETTPSSPQEALLNWKIIREEFLTTLQQVKEKLSHMQAVSADFDYLDSYGSDLDLPQLEEKIFHHQTNKPGLISRLFNFAKMQEWTHQQSELVKLKSALIKSSPIKETYSDFIIDKKLSLQDHKNIQQVSPWCNPEIQFLREKLFTLSIKLQKAFIDAAAKPLRHNLSLFLQFLSNTGLNFDKNKYASDLWSSFFLVVSSVSTTFASMRQMLGNISPDTLGWLLIDEAGQATPQSAVGAIMRTKRAIVVGDPMQIEPVVVLPEKLTQSIHKQFSVDPFYFNAPQASAQTLADEASPFYTEIQSRNGSRFIGIPLLVHRRCSEPMFSIANTIAYEGLMVQAKRSVKSKIADYLGASAWFHVIGPSSGKWCEEEGHALMSLLSRLPSTLPDLYIITPFRTVAYSIHKLLRVSDLLEKWQISENDKAAWLSERVGTVHTVQGREAEAVIFVLGAPSPDEFGARRWAGFKPNLLNVALTRAREVVYVIGNKDLWQQAGVFNELAGRMP